MSTLLVVDDEEKIIETLTDVLEDEGYLVKTASDGKEAIRIVETNAIDVVLLDLWLPEMGGMDVLDRIKEIDSSIQIIIISGHGSIDSAVRATKKGAFDFLEKPLSSDRVLTVVRNALEVKRLYDENVKLRSSVLRPSPLVRGVSRQFREIEHLVERCAESNARVFITGENGTGKEIIARWIHDKSERRNKPFVAVNCAAIPQTLIEAELFGYEKGAFTGAVRQKKGRFEIANGGTIFLDEIADMSLEAQAKVLRVLEEMQFERVGGVEPISIDVRVIAATNKDIQREISEGRFREDLYYRLNVVPIHIPPLRERREDIPLLAKHFIEIYCEENGKPAKKLTPQALKKLQNGIWRGNIRELENCIERAVILCEGDEIGEEYFTFDESVMPSSSRIEEIFSSCTLAEAERFMIEERLKKFNSNRTKAAQDLGISVRTLRNKLKLYREMDLDKVSSTTL